MSAFKDLISSINPHASGASAPSPSIQRLPAASSKPVARTTVPTSGASGAPTLKRKASGPVDGTLAKVQRKDGSSQPGQTNGAARTAPLSGGVKPSSTTPGSSMPYRGTAGLSVSRSATPPVKKPHPIASTPTVPPKAAAPSLKAPVSKVAGAAPASTTAPPPAKKPGGYMALLQKAKEKDQTKPATPPIKHEATKIMSKKDFQRARQETKAAVKGKKPVGGAFVKAAEAKADTGTEKRKPTGSSYQGTARPAKQPAESAYKGTARPSTTATPASKSGSSTARAHSKSTQGRYGGYNSWSEEDEMSEEGEEDYQSDASSDMEGDMWGIEDEEAEALKAAKQEDAKALAEENEHKRLKEERKRKLLAMSKQAASRRKY